eukprot:876926-Alexandrium_andersonii.AAC.1
MTIHACRAHCKARTHTARAASYAATSAARIRACSSSMSCCTASRNATGGPEDTRARRLQARP